jgi:hypothetical protein
MPNDPKTVEQAIRKAFGPLRDGEFEALAPGEALAMASLAATELGCDLTDRDDWKKRADAAE